MVVPPRYAKSLHVKNTTRHHVTLKATFGSEDQNAEGNKFIIHSHSVAPGEELRIPEQEYDMGSWTAVAPVYKVEVNGNGENGPVGTTLIPNPNRIIDILVVEVQNHPTVTNALQLTAV